MQEKINNFVKYYKSENQRVVRGVQKYWYPVDDGNFILTMITVLRENAINGCFSDIVVLVVETMLNDFCGQANFYIWLFKKYKKSYF